MTNELTAIGTRLKKLGYASGNQMKLYGSVFEVLSDPMVVAENAVFFDATEVRTGQVKRVRIPLPVVAMASRERRAA